MGFFLSKIQPLVSALRSDRSEKRDSQKPDIHLERARVIATDIFQSEPKRQEGYLTHLASELIKHASTDPDAVRVAAIVLCKCQNHGLDTSAELYRLEGLLGSADDMTYNEVSRVFSNAAKNIRPANAAFTLLERALNSRNERKRACAAHAFIRIGRDCEDLPFNIVSKLESVSAHDKSQLVRNEALEALRSIDSYQAGSRGITR